jgi:hypothetical protein
VFFGGAVLPSEPGAKFMMMVMYFGDPGRGGNLVKTWHQETVRP